jgi:hypothetical protein
MGLVLAFSLASEWRRRKIERRGYKSPRVFFPLFLSIKRLPVAAKVVVWHFPLWIGQGRAPPRCSSCYCCIYTSVRFSHTLSILSSSVVSTSLMKSPFNVSQLLARSLAHSLNPLRLMTECDDPLLLGDFSRSAKCFVVFSLIHRASEPLSSLSPASLSLKYD